MYGIGNATAQVFFKVVEHAHNRAVVETAIMGKESRCLNRMHEEVVDIFLVWVFLLNLRVLSR